MTEATERRSPACWRMPDAPPPGDWAACPAARSLDSGMRASGGLVAAVAPAIAVAAGLAVVALAADVPGKKGASRGSSQDQVTEPDRPAPQPVRVGAPLRPNLRSLPAENVHIEVEDGTRRLRFTSALANVGPGPLEVEPDNGANCPPGQRHAAQILYTDRAGDGSFDRGTDRKGASIPAGCMLDHPTHRHWHFDAMARYALAAPGATIPIVSKEKVSFCLRDSRAMPAASGSGGSLPGAIDSESPRPHRHYGDCGRIKVQGISPRWADVYKSDLPGQVLALPTGLADGAYCLHSAADPLGLLQEINEDDNAAVRSIVIDGNVVTDGEPSACRAD